jgi:hypothetical protein
MVKDAQVYSDFFFLQILDIDVAEIGFYKKLTPFRSPMIFQCISLKNIYFSSFPLDFL